MAKNTAYLVSEKRSEDRRRQQAAGIVRKDSKRPIFVYLAAEEEKDSI
jgi:hypothetical protein